MYFSSLHVEDSCSRHGGQEAERGDSSRPRPVSASSEPITAVGHQLWASAPAKALLDCMRVGDRGSSGTLKISHNVI